MVTAEHASQLDRLAFGGSRVTPSAAAWGRRAARVRGPGGEFHDFRRYQPGDDPRSIEWTIYGRLGQLVTRTYQADSHLRVHLIVDISRSMSIGSPDKLACAKQVAAILAYVAMRDGHALGFASFDDRLGHRLRPAAGDLQLRRVLAALGEASTGGSSSIGRALTEYSAAEHGPGLVVVISDCLDPAGLFQGLRSLLQRGLTPALVQILAPDELDPPLTGDTELVDVEDPTRPPLVVDAAAVVAYKAALAALRASLGEFCVTHGLPWMPVTSSDSFIALLHAGQRAGVLTAQG